MSNENFYDVVVIGGGPAGLTAALYLARACYRVLVIEKEKFGGQITITDEVVNYPGVMKTSGKELTQAMQKQAEHFGAEFLLGDVVSLKKAEEASGAEIWETTTDKGSYKSFGILLATGAHPRMIGFPGEAKFRGHGVAYCATCDGAVYTGKTVAVVTYSESQEDDVLYLAEMAQKVIFLPQYDSNLFCKNIETVAGKPASIEQTGSGICLRLVNGESIMADGVFLLRETLSPADLLPGLDMEGSSIKVDRLMQTNIAGCFAAGDCVGAPFQYLKAAGEGNIAAHSAVSYLAKLERSEIPS